MGGEYGNYLCFSPVQANNNRRWEGTFQYIPVGGLLNPSRDSDVFKWTCCGRPDFRNYNIPTASISKVNVIFQNNLWLNRSALNSTTLRKMVWFAENGLDRDR